MEQTALFREVQQFRQWWLYILLGGCSLMTGLMVGHGGFRNYLSKESQGTPLADASLAPMIIIAVTFFLVFVLVFLVMKLTIEVRPDGLYIRFLPVHLKFKKISLENVADQKPVTYHPIAEYGGWGIRRRKGKRAFNISGNRGVLITYSDGRTLLIGSQKPEELSAAIASVIG